jgi:hypothetical protein
MIEFRATYFDGRNSKAHPVSIVFNGVLLRIEGEAESLRLEIPFRDCTITAPLGRTARTIRLPGGAQCETGDLRAVRELEHRTGRNTGMRLVHAIESRWKAVAVSFLGLVVCVWAFMTHGIPFLAEKVAHSVPPELTERMSAEALEMLDDRLLEPSELDAERAAHRPRLPVPAGVPEGGLRGAQRLRPAFRPHRHDRRAGGARRERQGA